MHPIAALVCLSLALSSTTEPLPYTKERPQRLHMAIMHSPERTTADTILIGDSITEAFGGRSFLGDWRNKAGERAWERYVGPHTMNLGVSGDRTENVLWRINNGELQGARPEKIYILIGTNNIGTNSADDIASGIEAVALAAHRECPMAQITVVGLLPRDTSKTGKDLRETLEVNALLLPWADQNEWMQYEDRSRDFLKPDGSLNDKLFSDRLHPNAAGYEMLAEALFR